ncbi:hypothetical protein PAAG_11186 [Paracoccidioides lutzii Pb01]|uniref:Major facilitator superfamily (MFS) profile domain-containing protein n=1 Tax=Paracoccidioides lutzii (strain ATCC MYA-826 / Pb01) TaxID=502779 RepID=A0A0A2V2I3_PARBA|nr:hypothetical protein PAAG_11186 [Paracoccidioides lutzii Pb01]KGQ02011.1 hypothetical protein PAAG_11186 [Paracoccidioides lutzii Pb01]
MFCMFIGFFTPLFIPSYAVTRGVDTNLASYLLAIVNSSSAFGQIIPGLLADKFGRLDVLGIGAISTGIVLCCLNVAKSTAALVMYSVVFGFTLGTIISEISAAFTMCSKDPRDVGTYMGMGMALSSLKASIGPPVNGALFDKYYRFLEVSIFSELMCLVGGCIVIATTVTTAQGIFGKTSSEHAEMTLGGRHNIPLVIPHVLNSTSYFDRIAEEKMEEKRQEARLDGELLQEPRNYIKPVV